MAFRVQGHYKSLDEAEIWIVSEDTLDTYKDYCMNDPNHRAEGTEFIKKCIKRKTFQEELVVAKKPMATLRDLIYLEKRV